MNKLLFFIILSLSIHIVSAQTLKLKKRKANAVVGSAFALSISDSSLSLKEREKIIYKEIKRGNVPEFLRKLTPMVKIFSHDENKLTYYVLPDYFSIGSDDDFFYVPMTPMLAQKVANLTKCSLPTKQITDLIYASASIKLNPQPIAPTSAMSTVPIFVAHNDSIKKQLKPFIIKHKEGALTAGHKKDIIISNKIYGETSPRVVIYGWHKSNYKAIQPVYNKHSNTWVDYSHGVRLIQNYVYLNTKKTTLKKILKEPNLNGYFSDEGVIKKPYYPIRTKY